MGQEEDLQKEENVTFRNLVGVPKPLLPIREKPLITYWIHRLIKLDYIETIIIVSNHLHFSKYEEWFENLPSQLKSKPIHIVDEGSMSNEERSGAIACMLLGAGDLQDDALYIAGDILFSNSFNLKNMLEKFLSLNCINDSCCLIASSPVKEEDISKHGIIEIDDEGQVTSFKEKPFPTETTSRIQSPAFYIMPKKTLLYLKEFLKLKEDEPLSERDAPGKYLQYLTKKVPVFAFDVGERFDIGNLTSYLNCIEKY